MLWYLFTAATALSTIGLYYEGHLSRVDADEQTALARAAAATQEPTAAQREIVGHLEKLEETIRSQDVTRHADRNTRVVIQSAPLRTEPGAKAHVMRVVYPDDRVRVLDVRGNWALVEVFEYKSEATVTGWINRRVLRMTAG